MEITGKIVKTLDVQTGTSKDGKEWKKQSFLVETTEQYNNLYCIDIFGAEKVDNFAKYQKVGNNVKVTFNVNTNEWNGKYFTSLQSWRIDKAEGVTTPEPAPIEDNTDEMPF